MPYRVVRHPSGKGYALEKLNGGLHKSSKGHVYEYSSPESATGAAHYIAMSEAEKESPRQKLRRRAKEIKEKK